MTSRFLDDGKKNTGGTGTRYDPMGGNAIDKEREKGGQGMFLSYKTFRCKACNQSKPRKGGTNKANRFICKECAEKGIT